MSGAINACWNEVAMSFDLVVWPGSPSGPSARFDALRRGAPSEAPPLPCAALLSALKHAFGADLRVVDGVVQGRGWECEVDGAWTTLACDPSWAEVPSRIDPLIRAAHAAGCSVYDPQLGAYWPVALGRSATEDVWSEAVFDEFFVFEDEDEDEDDDGKVGPCSMRLCPDGGRPLDHEVRMSFRMEAGARGQLFSTLLNERATLYPERFPSWNIQVALSGPGARLVSDADLARWLKRTGASQVRPEGDTGSSWAFLVLGDLDVSALMKAIDPCPFELVPICIEQRYLASLLREPVASFGVVVPRRVARAAPELLREALRALDGAARSQVGGPVYYADPTTASGTAVGANVPWVEAFVGLDPREPICTVDESDVPHVEVALEGSDDDEGSAEID